MDGKIYMRSQYCKQTKVLEAVLELQGRTWTFIQPHLRGGVCLDRHKDGREQSLHGFMREQPPRQSPLPWERVHSVKFLVPRQLPG